MEGINPEVSNISNTPVKSRRYTLSRNALQQRCLAARRPRLGKRQLFLKLAEKVFDKKFQKILIRNLTTVLERQCREFIIRSKEEL